MTERLNDQKTALEEAPPGAGETAHIFRPAAFPDLECLSAHLITHRYAPHRHDTFVISVILSGAEGFEARGARHIAGPGRLVFLNPDELHDGHALGEHYRYNALYPSAAMMREAAAELAGDPAAVVGEPAFDDLVVDDPLLAARFVALFRMLEKGADPQAAEETLVGTLALAIARHARLVRAAPDVSGEPATVARVMALIDEAPEAEHTLASLAAAAGLSRYHFIRVFRRATGQTPHAYLVTRRVNRARALLAAGEDPASVAAACGFADQSHLTRTFKRVVGVTSGRYARALRG